MIKKLDQRLTNDCSRTSVRTIKELSFLKFLFVVVVVEKSHLLSQAVFLAFI